MFGSIGGSEFLLILVLALLLFGPRKLPQIGRTLGKALAELRGATHEFKSSLEREVDLEEIKEARVGLATAQREVSEAVNDATRLGVARGSIDEPEGARAVESEPETRNGGEPERS